MGVATALAIFEDAKAGRFIHGQIEALFTADEETTMGGAENLAPAPFLESDILLNVDSEEEYSICIGCAGGMENSFTLEGLSRLAVEGAWQCRTISLKGLLGGHSGIEIHTGRANSLKCLVKLVRMANRSSSGIRLVSFVGGGAPNVIPRESTATVSLNAAGGLSLADWMNRLLFLRSNWEHLRWLCKLNL
jgi:dipeptidase D